jgi:hypothetical protein
MDFRFWATLHATNFLQGMSDLETCKVNITVGNGKVVVTTQKGKKKLEIFQTREANNKVILQDVHYVPELVCNLFSLRSAMSNGGKISSTGLTLTVKRVQQDWFLTKSSRVQMDTFN